MNYNYLEKINTLGYYKNLSFLKKSAMSGLLIKKYKLSQHDITIASCNTEYVAN